MLERDVENSREWKFKEEDCDEHRPMQVQIRLLKFFNLKQIEIICEK